jgi:hypothetical protein
VELYDDQSKTPTGEWVYGLLAIRSDGYLYQANKTIPKRLPDGNPIKLMRSDLRNFLETMIDEIPSNVDPTPDPEHWMKGIVYQNGDEWVEAVEGMVQ